MGVLIVIISYRGFRAFESTREEQSFSVWLWQCLLLQFVARVVESSRGGSCVLKASHENEAFKNQEIASERVYNS